MTKPGIDAAVIRLAHDQLGAITWRQLEALGVTRGMTRSRVASGLWRRATRGVYVMAASPPNWLQRCKVAELSVPGSAVCGRSALRVHGVCDTYSGTPQLVVPLGASTRASSAVVRRSGPVPIVRVGGFRVVSVEQAICDIAGEASILELERVIDQALLDRLTVVPRLAARMPQGTACRLPGVVKLRTLVAERGEGFVVPESALEGLLYGVLADAGAPEVERQAPAPWAPPGDRRRFDAISRPWTTIYEGDGRPWHTKVADFERDRARDQEAAAHGFLTLRFTWAQLTRGRHEAIETIRAAGLRRAAA